jgi:alkaline phosphatase D
MGLDEMRDPHTAQHELAAFRVADGKAGVEMTPGAGRDSY